MKIDENLLLSHGAVYEDYQAKNHIFFAGDTPKYYMQITKGSVELYDYLDYGKEVTVGILSAGNSLVASLLFTDYPYPMNAIAKTDCTLLKLDKMSLLTLVKSDYNIGLRMFERLSSDLFYYYSMQRIIAEKQPVSKIKGLLDYYKELNGIKLGNVFQVPLTRQEIANMIGLRVETVVRIVKKMEQKHMLEIKERKIFY
ncbi:Crp/Fnr family transcriptional regulator [Chryseobacterium lathyri]|uniref:Crp/Fnr family transcriptional regulator n=1 Tax=Chryseobacterium lathyri TaxID=395933 RepID=UPI00277ED5C4|nr:Crp/Fnr family transcriptional regulator [Chryseobacterium lathyri]MDQ0065232.1 CRP-like cAMP-binding protein [Chryseobacterium lathyri]